MKLAIKNVKELEGIENEIFKIEKVGVKENVATKLYVEDFTELKGLENSMFKISSAEYRMGDTEKVNIINKYTKSVYSSTGYIKDILEDLKFLGFDVSILKYVNYKKLKEIMRKENITELYTKEHKVFGTRMVIGKSSNYEDTPQRIYLNDVLKQYGYKIDKYILETFQET